MSATTTRPVDDLRSEYGPAPERSLAQRFAALERANDIRIRRAALKRDVKAGRKTAEFVILAPPDYVATMKLHELLLAIPRLGRVKVNKVLGQSNVSPSKTLGGLTERQRHELVRRLRGFAPCPRPDYQIVRSVDEL